MKALPVTVMIAMPLTLFAEPARKAKVFVPESKSWEISGGFAANENSAAGAVHGGAQPQTAEITKQVMEKCPDIVVTMKLQNADYVLLLEHQSGKGLLRNDNKFVVYNKDGDAIKSGTTKTVGGSVKDACTGMMQDWKSQTPKPEPPPQAPVGQKPPEPKR